ncbi:hypothetical protein O3G_MSEX000214, partial [Manduca sexta]
MSSQSGSLTACLFLSTYLVNYNFVNTSQVYYFSQVGQVAGLIRGDGAGRGVSLLVWNCGVDPKDDPELLWSCGGGSRGERSRRALAGVVKALSCCVCASTATRALSCARSHLYCE